MNIKRSKWCYLLLALVVVFLVLPKDTLASDVFTYQWVGDLTTSYITTTELSTLTGISVLELRIGNILVSGNIMRGMEIDFVAQPSESALKKVDNKFPMLVRIGGLSVGDRVSVLESQPSSPQSLVWGNIGGTLSDQTDLNNALNSKLSSITGIDLDNVFTSNGLLQRTGIGTYTVDTNTYLTANSVNWKTGQGTRDISTASGVQNIAHGLGRVPRYVHIRYLLVFSNSISMECNAYYNGTSQSGMTVIWTEGGNSATIDNIYQSTISSIGLSNSGSINPFTGVTKASGIITFDGTNIIITWTKSGSPTGTAMFSWEVQ